MTTLSSPTRFKDCIGPNNHLSDVGPLAEELKTSDGATVPNTTKKGDLAGRPFLYRVFDQTVGD